VSQDLAGLLICLGGVGVLAVRWGLLRAGKATAPTTVALLVLALATHTVFLHAGLTQRGEQAARAPYHYVMGAKYYAELGHYGLYRMTLLAAEETGAFDPRAVPKVRKLEDYSFISVEDALATARAERADRFDDARWAEFCDDVRILAEGRDAAAWDDYFVDHGFNPPPARNIVPGLLLRGLDLDHPSHVYLMLLLDLILLMAVLVVCGAVCGADVPLLVFLFVMTAWFNESALLGNYLNYVWLAALIAAMTALRAEHFRTAGALLAVAASFRVFPALLLAGPLLLGGTALARRTRISPAVGGVILGFAISAGALGVAGLTQGGGPSATREFVANLSLHSEAIRWDSNKLGLRRALADTPWSHAGGRTARQERVESHPVLHYGALLLLLGLAGAAVLRSDRGARWAIPLGLCAVFAGLTLSRYYYLGLAVFLVAGPRERDEGFTSLAAGALLLSNAAWLLAGVMDVGRTATFSIGAKAIGGVLVLLPVLLLLPTLRSNTRHSGSESRG